MDLTIHDVNKIKFGSIEKLSTDERDKTYTRKVWVENSKGEELEITCFGECKENLQTEIVEVKKV